MISNDGFKISEKIYEESYKGVFFYLDDRPFPRAPGQLRHRSIDLRTKRGSRIHASHLHEWFNRIRVGVLFLKIWRSGFLRSIFKGKTNVFFAENCDRRPLAKLYRLFFPATHFEWVYPLLFRLRLKLPNRLLIFLVRLYC